MANIHGLHRSIRRPVRKPANMEWCKFPDAEARDAVTNIVLSIFTDACNVGAPLQDALLAVYLSGLEHGAQAKSEPSDG